MSGQASWPARLLQVLAWAAGVPLVAVLLVSAGVWVLGGDPRRALQEIHAGSIGSPDSLTETLLKTTPLLLTGLSVSVAFRCGIWNIGAEGQFLMGMLGSAVTALLLPPLPPFLAATLCILAGTAFGAAWAGVAAWLKLHRDVPEVISTIMLNFLAVYLLEYLVRGPLKDPTSVSDWSRPLPEAAHLPRFGRLWGVGELGWGVLRLPDGQPVLAAGVAAGRLHVGVLLALLAVPVAALWLARSGAGFRIRAVGLNPAAAQTAGISVGRTVATAFLTSGALAGLGGAVEQLAMISRLFRYAPGEPGYGFSGIAVALLGQLQPLGVLLAALFFGGLTAGCNQMQRAAGISFHVAYVIQAAVVLLLISLRSRPRPSEKQELTGSARPPSAGPTESG